MTSHVKFGDVVRNVNVTATDQELQSFEKVVGLDHLDPGELKISRWSEMKSLADGTTFRRIFRSGQVLFGKRRAYQRKVALPEFDGICSSDILVFESNSEALIPAFLPYLVQSDTFFAYALKTSSGSLSPRTRWEELSHFEFNLPSKEQQQCVVELMAAHNAHLTELRKSQMKAREASGVALQQLLADDKSLWRTERLGDVSETRLGKMLSGELSQKGGQEFPYLRNANIKWGHIDLSDLKTMSFSSHETQELTLRAGDLLVCEGGEPGRSALLRQDLPEVYFQKAIHRVRCGESLEPEYLYLWMKHLSLTGQINQYLTSTTIRHLTGEKLRQVSVSFPDRASQREIVAKVTVIDEVCRGLDAAIVATKSLQMSILNWVMSK